MKTPAQPAAVSARHAFTLIELLSIIAIFIILLSIAVASSVHWGRAARMRSSIQKARSALDQARQWSVTHSVSTAFVFTNDVDAVRGCYTIASLTQGLIGATNYLAKGILWGDPDRAGILLFLADGSLDAPTDRQIVLSEVNRANNLMTTVTVYRVTGRAKVEE